MRKIFTLFAAMLLAITASATGTDFAAPGYDCSADDAVLSGEGYSATPASNRMYLDEAADPHAILWTDVALANPAVATWTIESTRACYISVSLTLGHKISSNKHIYEVKVKNAQGKELGTLSEGSESVDSLMTKVLSGKILIPAAGTYTVELRNNRDFCKGTVEKITLKYASDAPTTDFSGDGYYCAADDAVLSGNAGAEKLFLYNTSEPHYIDFHDISMTKTAIASWKIIATRACFVNVKLDLGNSPAGNKHIFEVQLYDFDGNKIDTIAEAPAYTSTQYEYNTIKTLDGYLIIPSAGIYTVSVVDNRDFGKGAIKNVILQYKQDIPTIQAASEQWDNWATIHTFDLAADGQTASKTLNLAQGDYWFKMIIGGTWKRDDNSWWFTRANNSCTNITNTDAGNMKIVADYTSDYILTWRFKDNSLTITYPVIPDPVFYVAGNFTQWETNKVAMTEEAGICTASIALGASVDTCAYKILKIDAWGNKTWYGAQDKVNRMEYGNSTDWQLTTTDGGNNINLTTTLATNYEFIFNASNAQMSVTIPDPSGTNIDNNVVSDKAVKFFKDGQLFIQKDGKIYNALGVEIR